MLIEPNNIYLGDAYELIKGIPDNSVDLIYTDIPYKVKGIGNDAEKLMRKADEMGERMKEAQTDQEYEMWHQRREGYRKKARIISIKDGITEDILDEFTRIQKHIYIYIWCSKEQIMDLMEYYVKKHNCYFNLLVWCKTNAAPLSYNGWIANVEYCMVFREKGAPLYTKDGTASKYYISPTNYHDKKAYDHPTIKPYELVKNHILHSSNPGDVVLDPFVGSGTTCKACKDTGRQYIGFEMNEAYYRIAIDRMNNINIKGEVSLF